MIKKRILLTILWIFIIVIVSTIIINTYMILSVRNKIVDMKDLDDSIDYILVLGCRVENDIPSLMLSKRLEKTIDVYNKLYTKVIVSGDSTRSDYDEVGVMSNYLLTSIDKDNLILDKDGITTYDSIYRAKYVYNAKKIVIITQKYHIYRALYLANKLDLDAVGIVADDIPQKFVMAKNHLREILARNKNFFKGIIKPKIEYAY